MNTTCTILDMSEYTSLQERATLVLKRTIILFEKLFRQIVRKKVIVRTLKHNIFYLVTGGFYIYINYNNQNAK